MLRVEVLEGREVPTPIPPVLLDPLYPAPLPDDPVEVAPPPREVSP